eukprot:747951-Hanusia_phi.AAC.1
MEWTARRKLAVDARSALRLCCCVAEEAAEYTRAELGAHTAVLDLKQRRQSSCGGASGDCMDET